MAKGICIFRKDTKEVIAAIEGEDIVLQKDYDFTYADTFIGDGKKVYIGEEVKEDESQEH